MEFLLGVIQNFQNELIAFAIILSSWILAFLFYKLYFPILHLIPGIRKHDVPVFIGSLRLPIVLIMVGVGALLAVKLPLDLSGRPVTLGLSLMGLILGAIGIYPDNPEALGNFF